MLEGLKGMWPFGEKYTAKDKTEHDSIISRQYQIRRELREGSYPGSNHPAIKYNADLLSELTAEEGQLRGKAQMEGDRLNEKYDDLRHKAEQALLAVRKFKKEKLGTGNSEVVTFEYDMTGDPHRTPPTRIEPEEQVLDLKEYSREKWDAYHKIYEQMKRELEDDYKNVYPIPMFSRNLYLRNSAIDDRKKQLDRLPKQGHKEAEKLSTEYDELLLKARKAVQALEKFGIEKLGWSKEIKEDELLHEIRTKLNSYRQKYSTTQHLGLMSIQKISEIRIPRATSVKYVINGSLEIQNRGLVFDHPKEHPFTITYETDKGNILKETKEGSILEDAK